MSLMALGPVVFDLVLNPLETESQSTAAFAKHEIVNGSPIWEAMGEDESTFTISGVIFPDKFGGESGLNALEAARAAQIPLPLMRGDFVSLGWVLVKSVTATATYLNWKGRGQKIEFTVELIQASNPGASAAPSILALF